MNAAEPLPFSVVANGNCEESLNTDKSLNYFMVHKNNNHFSCSTINILVEKELPIETTLER